MIELLLAALVAATSEGEVITRGDIVAGLAVRIPDEGAAPGLARVRVEISVSGPETLAVEPPRLEDALAAWRVVERLSSWREEEGRSLDLT